MTFTHAVKELQIKRGKQHQDREGVNQVEEVVEVNHIKP